MRKTSNTIKIKSNKIDKWMKEAWPYRITTSIFYCRKEKFVKVGYLEHGDNDYLVPSSIYYPILNSYKKITGIKAAMAPYLIADHYKEFGYFLSGGHTLLSIAGLKNYLKDIGIKTRILKSTSDSHVYKYSEYSRIIYKIYPKTDIDYAMFLMYFSEDIGEPKPPQIWKTGKILPISVKFTTTIKKSKKKNDKTK